MNDDLTPRESAVLGTILIHPDRFHELDDLPAAALSTPEHRTALRAMRESGRPDDVAMVRNALAHAGGDEVAAARAVARMLADGVKNYNIAHTVGLIKAARWREKLAILSGDLAAAHDDTTAREALDACQKHIHDKPGAPPDHQLVAFDGILDRDVPDVPWVVDGLLAAGDMTFLAGTPSSGKSLLAMHLAVCIATDQRFLDWKAMRRPGRVLYLDEEMGLSLATKRLRAIVRHLGADEAQAAENLAYYSLNGFNLDDPQSFGAVQRIAEDFQPDWIFLDSLVRFHARDENSNSEMAQFFHQRVRPLAGSAGVIVLHHLTKENKDNQKFGGMTRMRGAGDIGAVADCIILLEGKQEDGDERTIKHVKCRHDALHEEIRIKADIDPEADTASVTRVDDPLRETAEDAIVRVITLNPAITTKEIGELTGFSQRRTREIVKELDKIGLIQNTPKPRPGGGARLASWSMK